jgi:hypothetical protein
MKEYRMNAQENLRRLRTVPFRMAFPILPPMPPRTDEMSGRKTYGILMLFPPPFDDAPFRTALEAAMIAKHGDRSKWPRCKRGPDDVIKDFAKYNADMKTPLQGDWSGWWCIGANATAMDNVAPPAVVGAIMGPDKTFPRITDLREIYGGRWARATIDAYYFEIPRKNNGVTFGLSNVQLLKHAERFGFSRPPAERDFDEVRGEMAGEGDAFETGLAAATKDTDDNKW